MFTTIVIFIAVLSILVLAHEFGHFITAKKSGVDVEEFGIGFPPRIWSIKKGRTTYSINAIPLGGFVKLKGEDGEDVYSEDSFAAKKVWQRALIISAGVIMNVVLAAVLFSVGFMVGIPQAISPELGDQAVVKERKLQVVEVLPDYPAAKADIQLGDVILGVDNENFITNEELSGYLTEHSKKQVVVQIKRGDDILNKEISPVVLEETNKAGLGVGLVESGLVSYPFHLAVWNGLKATYSIAIAIVIAFYGLLKNLLTGNGIGADVAGPVGIAVYTGRVAQLGWVYLMQFTALLSINLAIINFLPFPALDGGRFLFLIIEKIRRRPVNQKIENLIHNIGFSLLILLVIVVTFKDVSRFSDKFIELWHKIIG